MFMDKCAHYKAENVDLDTFTAAIAAKLKEQGVKSQRGLATIVYSRRFVQLIFAVNIMFEVLELGETKENQPPATKTETENSAPSLGSGPSKVLKEVVGKSMDRLNKSLAEQAERQKREQSEKQDSDDEEEEEEPRVSEVKEEGEKTKIEKESGSHAESVRRQCACCMKAETDSAFLVCGYCKREGIIIPYCSQTCQQRDWTQGHKTRCKGKK